MINIEKYGFRLERSLYLDEIDATLYELSYIKCGASLIYLDREDENKTFAIGFATPPCDDTGVFHIIEHSVLCGSKKYPLNDPFAELLKGSLNTFLNAMTFEDRTIYPVSSRCEKDFLNLVDVYMDAVISPNMLKNPSIFRQEGWRYEYDADSNSLSYNGVVYNEMKGAYSSPDELGGYHLNRALFSGTPYCQDSGGNPSAIPELTYEQFKATHEKYYHPSGARIVLDGRIDLDKILPILDSHLAGFEKRERLCLAGKSEARTAADEIIHYEISDTEDEHGKARVLYGYVFSDYSDVESSLTASVLSDILCGSNASPLKKAIIDRGLAKNVYMYVGKSRELTLVIEIRDADETRLDEIDEVISEVISQQAKDGISKKNIISSLNSIEFRIREKDYGSLPTGIVLAMSLYGAWVYDNNPEQALLLDSAFESIKKKVSSDHFEKALIRMTLENEHRAKIIMLPDKSLTERMAKEEKEKLDNILSSMTDEEKERIIKEEEQLHLWQAAEPTEEALASLPELSLRDIPERSDRPFAEINEIDGIRILRSPVKTNGIIYTNLLFDASDLQDEDFATLGILISALKNFPTERQDALSLQNDIKENLGGLSTSFAISGITRGSRPYLKIGAKALKSKSNDIIRLIGELLLSTKIEDEAELAKIVRQVVANQEDLILSSGESLALIRLEATRYEEGSISEYMAGYEAYRILKEKQNSPEAISELAAALRELLTRLIDKRRLMISIAGDTDREFIEKLISIFPDSGIAPEKKPTSPCASPSEFFLLPSKVAYAVLGGESKNTEENLGYMRVARSILSYEYLWNTVRVQGGAYGTGFVPRREGLIAFYSYRDPSPARSINAYKDSAGYLRSLADADADITKFIIGSIGEYDTLITPRTASSLILSDYLRGWTPEDEEKTRSQMLNMTAKDLRIVANIIDEALSDGSQIIVGGAEHLATLETEPEKIIKI